jgi:spore germination protein KB
LGRTAEVFIVILISLGLIGNLFVYLSGNINLSNLQPFLENGWKPIVTTAFPITTFFPFGQMLVFTMLLPYLDRPESVKKVWLSAIISSAFFLSYTTSLDIAVLSVEEVERTTFPLLSTIRTVDLFEFIQRLDAVVVFTLLITMFFKASIFLYGAIIGVIDLFKLKHHQQIMLPIGVISLLLSMVIASNFAEHIEEGLDIMMYSLHLPFMVIIPLFMLLVSMIRNGFKKKDRSKSNVT